MPAHASQPGPGPTRTPASARRAGGLVAALVVALAVLALGGGLALVYRASVHARAAAQAAGDAGGAALRVTRRFGATPMLVRSVLTRPSDDVLALLAREATVTTSYGGGFVGSIGGVASGYAGANPVREDWFFYINGLQAHTGAADVPVKAGDRIWWDFHAWDFAASVPAVVGQFPAPFATVSRAERPTQVLFADGFEAQARAVASALVSAGATSTTVAAMTAAAAGRPGNVVLVGRWGQLATLASVRDAAASPGGSGVLARFTAAGVDALGEHGQVARHDDSAGAVLATAKTDEPDAALWLVTGTADANVRAAAALLGDGGSRLAGRFGALVTRDGAVVSLPIAGSR